MSDQSIAPVLEVRHICKRFPGVRALHDVGLTLARGEVLALIGENGAGKSTLMKILAGVQSADSGQILIDGRPVVIDSVHKALRQGVALIHQELNLAGNLDVAANIFLGREPLLRLGLIDTATIHCQASGFLDKIGLDVAPTTLVGDLPIGQQQMVEIAKALSVNARVLIMDEPTSSLSAKETDALFRVVRELRSSGVSVIYISHRLGEVKELADRVSVLRDGENAGDLSRDQIDHDAMVRLMVGREISQFYARRPHKIGDIVLEVDRLVTPAWPQHPLSFGVRAGQIVGVAGLVGAGRTEMVRTLFGIDQPLAGTVRVKGQTVDMKNSLATIRSGLALVPEDRKQHGLVLEMSVRENTSLAGLRQNALLGGFLNRAEETRLTQSMVQRLSTKTPSLDQVAHCLSGGNQQKVVLGKWLSLAPQVLLLDEPTRGIDVGAKEEIYRLMEELAEQGVAILFVSSEMEEILGMSDRVLVMHEGRISGELDRDELSEEGIMQLATGRPQAA
ncbi:MAG: ATP-binding cassette domain-containing protein [Planctomycetales bacterium]|nr:ATP-binding cassette domain-containing protein [Planctomycetales bacterium]NIM08972.1 ATP-binding cassette domain-containing protein [Planctomycetales bacterium]NIN08435.1 ATP-binding cassette domain-containing protein [Planctomycetales bacterium]NIN77564.1 ATP-binding cassette domain-containing protein [Planctomycetales bacterium]NIO34734.1 ATP-binding cassette domain-containing protein [Planctomycetales bacterium]